MNKCDICLDTNMSYCVTEEQLNLALAGKVDKNTLYDYYLTKETINDLLNEKADVRLVDGLVSRDELDPIYSALDSKADKSQLAYYITSEKLSIALDSYMNENIRVYYVTKEQLDDVLEGYVDVNTLISFYFTKDDINNLLASKLDVGALTDYNATIENKLGEKVDKNQLTYYVTKEQLDSLLETIPSDADITSIVTDITTQIDNKVDKNQLTYYVTKEQLDSLLSDKINQLQFSETITEISNELDNKVSINTLSYYYDKANINELLDTKADKSTIAEYYYSKQEMNTLLDGKIGVEDLEIEFGDALESAISDKVNEVVDDRFNNTYSKGEVNDLINEIVDNTYTKYEVYTKPQVDAILDETINPLKKINDAQNESIILLINDVEDLKNSGGGDSDLTNYYTKAEIDSMIGNVEVILNNIIYGV